MMLVKNGLPDGTRADVYASVNTILWFGITSRYTLRFGHLSRPPPHDVIPHHRAAHRSRRTVFHGGGVNPLHHQRRLGPAAIEFFGRHVEHLGDRQLKVSRSVSGNQFRVSSDMVDLPF